MFERFTRHARAVVTAAVAEARRLQHGHVGTEHLLLGVLATSPGIAAQMLADLGMNEEQARRQVEQRTFAEPDAAALESIGIDLDAVRRKVEEAFGPGALERRRVTGRSRRRGHVPFTPRAKQALESALRESIRLRHRWIGTEHILLGLLRVQGCTAARLLAAAGVDHPTAEARVLRWFDDDAASG